MFLRRRFLYKRDRIFFLSEYYFSPTPEDLEKTLKKIYDARSSSLHSGSVLPRSIAIGTSSWIDVGKLPLNPLKPDDVPPVAWFERVVYVAAQKFLLGQTAAQSCPL